MTDYFVSAGKTRSGITLNSGDSMTVLGTATSITINSGGFEVLSFGGLAISTTINSSGYETISFGGAATSTTVSGGGLQLVSGGASIDTTLSGGTDVVVNGGQAVSTTVGTGGLEVVSGGSASSTLLSSGGTQVVSALGQASETVVYNGALQILSSGGAATGAIVSGGTETVLSGGTAIHTTVDGGGIETVGGLASNTTIAGGTLDLLSGGTATGSILFAGSGLLIVQGTTMPATAISGFAVPDVIDLAGVVYTGSGTTAFDSATDVLTVTEGGASYQLTLPGDYGADTFALAPGTGSGTLITLSAPCFAAGTLILTDQGEIAVEDLAIGDRVMTVDGEAAPILWIGHRRIACERHAEPGRIWPVRIAAHAFGPDAPHRDLLLSPDHAILAEGVLIPVRHLINGTTIRQRPVARVAYFHIQFACHTAILANGLPAESYLDTGDIGSFANGPGPVALHPAFGAERGDITLIMDALGYAPLRVTGPEVETVRKSLARRSELADSFQLLRKRGE